MSFNRKLLIDGPLKDAWRAAHSDNIEADLLEADTETSLPQMCDELLSWIKSDDGDRRRSLSLVNAALLTSGLARLYRRKVQNVYEDLYKKDTDNSLTSDESSDENEDERIKRETSLISLRKRRRPTTSDELDTIRHYITDEDGSSHASTKIRSRDSLSNGSKQLSQITDNHKDESSTDDEKEIVDDDEEPVDIDEEIVDDEVASSDRNLADDSDESSSILSINEKSFVLTTNKAETNNLGQQNKAELKCIGIESHTDDGRVEGEDSRNKFPMGIDDALQLMTVRDTHEEVPGCEQSTNGDDVPVAGTNNDQPTGAAQEKQKGQMTQTILSSFNRPRGELSQDTERADFRRDLPFGCLMVYDSYNSRVPSQIILSSLDENVRKLKKH